MNATSSRSFPATDSLPRGELRMGAEEKSPGNVLRFNGVDSDRFRVWFAPAFARWLRVNFRDPETVAVTFGVRYRTALNWWNGDNRAHGDTVGLVFVMFPQAVGWFLSEWSAQGDKA